MGHSIRTLSNTDLTIKVSPQGAELCSIVSNTDKTEYLWQADPAFWKRHSPVLFPIVGAVWNNEIRQDGKSYSISQHGFARDKKFSLVAESPTEIRYRLLSDEETLAIYPFHFQLEIGYRLNGKQVEVCWSIKNTGTKEMHFQIGAHPAFNYPAFDVEDPKQGFFAFDPDKNLEYILISEQGCVSPDTYTLALENGLLPINKHTFDKDAIILENSQLKSVALLNKQRQPYLTLHFNAPVVGLWSPPGKNAPFVCIEPWYGRCDSVHYSGEYKDKEWMQHLVPGEVFNAAYTIEINHIDSSANPVPLST